MKVFWGTYIVGGCERINLLSFLGGGGGWKKPNLSYPWNLPRSSLVFVWVLLAVHFRPSSEFLAVDRSVSHTFISSIPFIHQFSVLLPSWQFSLSDGFGPVENSAVPHGTQGAPTSAGAQASRLVPGSFQKAAPGPQRTWQDPPPQKKNPCPVCGQAGCCGSPEALAQASLNRPTKPLLRGDFLSCRAE